MEKRVLIIGAGGFIGGYIAAESLRRGYETWVAVRESTSRRYLKDDRLHFIVLDYDNPTALASALTGALPQGEKWDWIVYNLGATKCTNFADFNRINFAYLRTFVEVLRATGLIPERFLYMSSLSALGPGDEKGYTPMSGNMIPAPNTRYGLSKIKAETYLETCADLPWTIFRPTGVYGPTPNDYMMMLECIDSHFDFGVGMRRQLLTFIEVSDLARAVFDALASEATVRRKYIISEDRAYTQKEFRGIVAREMGKRFVIPVRLPLWTAYVASVVAEKYGVARMQASTLNRDKFKIMKQRNWACDISDAQRDFGFNPRVSLAEGMKRAVEGYRKIKAERKAAKKNKDKN